MRRSRQHRTWPRESYKQNRQRRVPVKMRAVSLNSSKRRDRIMHSLHSRGHNYPASTLVLPEPLPLLLPPFLSLLMPLTSAHAGAPAPPLAAPHKCCGSSTAAATTTTTSSTPPTSTAAATTTTNTTTTTSIVVAVDVVVVAPQ